MMKQEETNSLKECSDKLMRLQKFITVQLLLLLPSATYFLYSGNSLNTATLSLLLSAFLSLSTLALCVRVRDYMHVILSIQISELGRHEKKVDEAIKKLTEISHEDEDSEPGYLGW